MSGTGAGPGAETDGDDETIVDALEELTALLVLGVGLTALFLGYDWFWLVFVLGFVVFLPLVGVVGDLLVDAAGGDADPDDPLETLKERYARGEIDEVEFERRLERLVDADDPAEAARRLDRRAADGLTSDAGPDTGERRSDRPGTASGAEPRDRDVEYDR